MAELHIPFGQGIEEGVCSDVVDPQQGASEIQTLAPDRRGSLSKTLGYTSLSLVRSDSTSRATARRLLKIGDQLCVIDGVFLDSYIPNGDVNVKRDRVPEASIFRRPAFGAAVGVSASQYTDQVYDAVCVNGFLICTYIAGPGHLLWVALDVATLTVIAEGELVSATLTSAGPLCKLSVLGSTVIAVFEDGTPNTLKRRILNASTAFTLLSGWASSGVLVSDWGMNDFDICAAVNANVWYLVYDRDKGIVGAATGTVGVVQLDVTGSGNWASHPITTADTTLDVACCVTGSELFVAYRDASVDYVVSIAALSRSTGAALISGPDTAISLSAGEGVPRHLGIESPTPGTCYITSEAIAGTISSALCMALVVASYSGATWTYTPGTGGRRWGTLGAIARPQVMNGRVYQWVFHNGDRLKVGGNVVRNSHQVVSLVDITDAPITARPIAIPAPRLMGWGSAVQLAPFACMHALSTGANKIAALLPRIESSQSIGFDLVDVDFADPKNFMPCEANGVTAICAGAASAFDGRLVNEIGFTVRPSVVLDVSGGAALTASIGLSYVALYAQTNARGDIEWGNVSNAISTGAIAGKDVVVSITTNPLTTRQDDASTKPIRIFLYRTDNGGKVYHLVTTLENNPAVGFITYTDVTADVSAGHLLYGTGILPTTQGASQPRQCFSGIRHACRHGDRMVAILDDARSLGYTAPFVSGEGIWTSQAFLVEIPCSGYLVAVTSQDGSIIALAETEIYAVSGDGPPDNGGSGTEFSAPRRVASDVGCMDPRSVVTCSLGTLFQSHRGLELLNRGLSVEWIGEAVRSTLATFPVVTSAYLDEAANRVRFTLVAEESSNGLPTNNSRTLILDLGTRRWFADDDYATVDPFPTIDTIAVRVGGAARRHWVRVDGIVCRETLPGDAEAHLRSHTWRRARWASAWYNVAGLAGWGQIQRANLLFKPGTAHDLKVWMALDGADFAGSPDRTILAADVLASGGHLDLIVTTQKCRSFRIAFEDAYPTTGSVGTGKGSTYYDLSIGYEPIGGMTKRPDTAR